MKHKRRESVIGTIIGFVIIALIMFSCSASAKDKNIEVIKGKMLREAAPSYWENTKTISIYYSDDSGISADIRGDTAFQEKINNCLQSYHWKIDEYLIEQLKQKLHINRDATISLIDLAGTDVYSMVKTVQPSDKHIVLMLSFEISGIEKKAPLDGHINVAIATEEAMQQFIKNCNNLPLHAFGWTIHPAKKENQLSQYLEHIKLYPGLYMGDVGKHTKEFSKDEWLSENGAFLERQLQSLVNDLAKGVSDLFF